MVAIVLPLIQEERTIGSCIPCQNGNGSSWKILIPNESQLTLLNQGHFKK